MNAGSSMVSADVAIVGAGPVGSLLSVLLQTYGVSTALVDTDTTPYRLPRAIVMDDENQRYFHMLGLGDALAAMTTPLRGADFVSATRERLFGAEIPPVGNLGVPPVLCHYQPELDVLLRGEAERRGAATLFGRTAVGLSRHPDRVDLALDDGTSVTASYLVGCDGASSWTRREVGLELEDLGFDQDWVVVDVELRDGRGGHLPPVLQQVCDPARPTTYVPGHARYRRWEFQVQPGDDVGHLVSERGMWELLSGWLTPTDADIVRTAAYRFHAVVAPRMRDGRVLLAGDSAHQMPPFLGQGLNSGMRDAVNVAWKLAWVLDGLAGEGLLDTYTAERGPHVRSVVAHAADMGRLIDQLAGREVHGVDESSGYGGKRPVPRIVQGVVTGDDVRVGLPCPWIPEIWRALESSSPRFVVATGAGPCLPEVIAVAPPHRAHVVVTESLTRDEWLLVRPDGIVAAAGTGVVEMDTASDQIASRLGSPGGRV